MTDTPIGPDAASLYATQAVSEEKSSGFMRPAIETIYSRCIKGEAIYQKAFRGQYNIMSMSDVPANYRYYLLRGLCAGGHRAQVKSVLARFSGRCDRDHLAAAAVSGDVSLLMCVWARTDQTKETLNFAMHSAGYSGNMEMISWLIDAGADNFNQALRGACMGGHVAVATAMITCGATDFNGGLKSACAGDWPKLANLMIASGAHDYGSAFGAACAHKNSRMMKHMYRRGAVLCAHCNMPAGDHFMCSWCC